jgi:hypothetical protein
MVLIFSTTDLLKAKAAAQGTVSVWADGTTRKKVGNKWVAISSTVQSAKKVTEVAEQHFNYAMTTNMGGIVEKILNKYGVKDFNSLMNKIKTGSSDTAHKMYKDIVDTLNSSKGTQEDRQTAAHLIGTALVKLKDHFSTGPKAKAKIKVTSKKGKEYYKYPSSVAGVTEELPLLKPSAISRDKKKMGGWSVTGSLSSSQVNTMIKNGTAKLVSGKINSKKLWVLPKKAEDMELKYTGDSLLIHVKQVRKIKDRTRATAKVDIKIPYTFAKGFLLNQIGSKKTRNNFIFRMENSSGYRKFMEKNGA